MLYGTESLKWFKCCKYLIIAAVFTAGGQVSSKPLIEEKKTITIPLSQPSSSGRLRVNHYKGSIKVSGYDGTLVMATATYRESVAKSGKNSNTVPELSAVERNNDVTIYTDSERLTVDLDIMVPRNMDLHLQTYDNGRIEVTNVTGEMEINNTNGPITLIGVSGPAMLSTIDGNILVKFSDIPAETPMAFTSISGDIDLTFPAAANLNLKMKTEYGAIFHDSSIKLFTDKSSGSLKIGILNRGGAEAMIKTLNGNIYIR